MAKRLHSDFFSLAGVKYDLEIYDTDFTGISSPFLTERNSVELTFDSEDQQRHNPILPASLSFNMKVENASQEAFITDLAAASEDRFQVMLKQGMSVLFVGYIITDLVQIENINYPFSFQVQSVDGVGRLKELEYNNAGAAYSGKETIQNHIGNIIAQIGLSSLAGTTLAKLTEWAEDSHQVGADLLENTRVRHELFTKQDQNGNYKYSNPYAVLKEICSTFLARFLYWNGSYHFQQINKYSSHSGYDATASKQVRGGVWRYLPPLRQVRTLLKYGEALNVAIGLNLNQANLAQNIEGDFKAGKAFEIRGQLEYRTVLSSTYIANNGIVTHRVRFGLMFRLRSTIEYYYLKRTSNSPDFYHVYETETNWTEDDFITKHYYELSGDVIYNYNYGFNKVITINVVTPEFPGVDTTIAGIELILLDIRRSDGGILTSPDVEVSWNLRSASLREKGTENVTIDREKIYTASNTNTGNSKSVTIEMSMGDLTVATSPAQLEVFDGANWLASNSWGVGSFSGIEIGQLLSNEILSGQSVNTLLLDATLIMSNFSPLHRLTYKNIQYLFLRGTWLPERDQISGSWAQIHNAQNNVSNGPPLVGDGSNSSNPADPNLLTQDDRSTPVVTDSHDATDNNVNITLLDLIKSTKANQDLRKDQPISSITVAALESSVRLYQGDIIDIVNPVTGETGRVTLAANQSNPSDPTKYLSGDTTLYINSYTPPNDFPHGSHLIKNEAASPTTNRTQKHKVVNHTGAFVDVPFDIPTNNDEIDKRLVVQREFATGIYEITYNVGNDNSGKRRRITPIIPFDNEGVLIILSE